MMEPCWALFYQDLLILALHGPFRGPCRSKTVPWALVELNNDQISVGQPHPALGLKPLNNDRSLGHLVKALWIFSFPSLCHQYNTIGKPQTEPCRYTSYIHQYVKKNLDIGVHRHVATYIVILWFWPKNGPSIGGTSHVGSELILTFLVSGEEWEWD